MLTEEKTNMQKVSPARETKKGDAISDSNNAPHKSSRAIWIVAVLFCIVGGLAFWGMKRRQNTGMQGMRGMGQPLVPILAGTVEEKDVPVYLDGLGTVQAYNTVTVRVRVDGELKKVAFTEGQDVHKGDLLAQIDPDPYQAALNQAKARLAQDEAQLANARVNLKRETELLAAKIDAQQVYDAQKALTDQLEATVKADQAAIESAQVNLNYTTIVAPLDGRTGIRQVDQGNQVHTTDSNGIVVITQLQPISVVFTLPEQDLELIHKEMSQSGDQPKVLAVGRDDTDVFDEGTLAVIDNQIDSTTGTIKLKANFPNKQNRLWPGQFVNARFLLTVRKGGLVVPTAAIQRGPNGAYVFVVKNGTPPAKSGSSGGGGHHKGQKPGGDNAKDAESKVAANDSPAPSWKQNAGASGASGADKNQQPPMYVVMQPVTVADEVTGPDALVTSGLQKGERIVVDGQYKLQDGSPVRLAQTGKPGNADAGSKNSNP